MMQSSGYPPKFVGGGIKPLRTAKSFDVVKQMTSCGWKAKKIDFNEGSIQKKYPGKRPQTVCS